MLDTYRLTAHCFYFDESGSMHVFIDESGVFTGFHAGSISVVSALAIPDAKLDFLKKKYAEILIMSKCDFPFIASRRARGTGRASGR
jgi:hypothetical protein